MNDKTVIDLDTFFSLNYTNLLAYCYDRNIEPDNVNEVYIKLKGNTYPTGMTIQEYNFYIKKSLWNLMLDEKKSLRFRNTVSFEDVEKQDYEMERALQEIHINEEDSLLYREQTEWLTKMLFRFIEVRGFTEYEIFIFKSYFLVPKMTYKKLNSDVGIDMNRIQRTIRKFKAEIKTDFITWIKQHE